MKDLEKKYKILIVNYELLIMQLKFKEWKGKRTWSFSYENYLLN